MKREPQPTVVACDVSIQVPGVIEELLRGTSQMTAVPMASDAHTGTYSRANRPLRKPAHENPPDFRAGSATTRPLSTKKTSTASDPAVSSLSGVCDSHQSALPTPVPPCRRSTGSATR